MSLAARFVRTVLPPNLAFRAVQRLAAGGIMTDVVVPVDLGGPAPTPLELDLALGGCVEMLVRPPRRSSDWPSLDVFEALVREARTVFDIGANVGLFTYVAASHAKQASIRAYEPNPRLAGLIERNVARNGWASRATVRREGVSATSEARTFYLHEIDVESSFEPGRGGTANAITVPVVALDDVFAREGIDPLTAVLKIDVEGHEVPVLDGFAKTLAQRGARPTLLMEFLGRAITDDRIIERVLDLGLDVYYVASRGLVRLTSRQSFVPVQELGQWNFLLTDRAPPSAVAIS
jgi:FkbM family methyltransferase